jgi:hypothetical protein
MHPIRLIVLGVAAVLAASQIPVRTQGRLALPDPSGYVGSKACGQCHEEQYGSWRKTLHVQMTKPIAEATVVGDFRPGTRIEQYGRSASMETHDGRYFITIAKGDAPSQKYEVNYTLGARRFQGYLSKLPDGRIYVLPVFWHNETKRWLDYKEITPIPDDPDHDLRQIWNVTCVNCHATNIVKNFKAEKNTYATTWTEMGIGCEACHGPGQPHIDDPQHKRIFSPNRAAPRQVFDTCGYCHGNKNNEFFGFKAGDRYEDFALPFLISEPIPPNDPQGEFWPDGRPSRFNRPQALTVTGCFRSGQATCTSCHRMHAASPNAHALKVPVETPDGRRTKESDLLCTQCHGTETATPERESLRSSATSSSAPESGTSRAPERESLRSSATSSSAPESGTSRAPERESLRSSARSSSERGWGPASRDYGSSHTHHFADSPGSRCVECHMSDVNWRLFTRRRDHTFQPPVPEMTARYGVPNACTTCHEDKSPEWAAKTMDAWYGNAERRRAVVAVADVMYRAGAGDETVLPDVAKLAVDRSHGTLIRASAAEFVAQLLEKRAGKAGGAGGAGLSDASQDRSPAIPAAIVNSLIGAASDPEPQVRTMAVRGLSLVRDSRILPVLAARLEDDARVVRVSAAEALMTLGVVTLDGSMGQALSRAQDEWAASLATFNDVANDHTMLGRLEAARGRPAEAESELTTASRLDPKDAKPHVYLGVVAARAGKYDEALQQFKIAKSLSPSYQNLDRLIEEAQKRALIRH